MNNFIPVTADDLFSQTPVRNNSGTVITIIILGGALAIAVGYNIYLIKKLRDEGGMNHLFKKTADTGQ